MNQNDLQLVADLTADFLHIPSRQIHVKDILKGRCTSRGYVSIPRWALTEGEQFAFYYVIHEMVHLRRSGHGPDFKKLEMEALQAWGLIPIYLKAYPKQLVSTNGLSLWRRKR